MDYILGSQSKQYFKAVKTDYNTLTCSLGRIHFTLDDQNGQYFKTVKVYYILGSQNRLHFKAGKVVFILMH